MYKEFRNIVDSLNLTDEQIEAVYRIKQLEYRIQDINDYIEDIYINGYVGADEYYFVKEHAEELAEKFLNKYENCDIPENKALEMLISDFISDNLKEYMIPIKWTIVAEVPFKAGSKKEAIKLALETAENLEVPDEYQDCTVTVDMLY